MYVLNDMSVTVDKEKVLSTLIKNRETHSQIVKEARHGYLEKAKRAIEKKLEQLDKGKIVALNFTLAPPQSYKKVYDTAIKMLEMHTGATIQLNAAQVRQLVMDQWDWKDAFIASSSAYSATAAKYVQSSDEEDEE